VNFNFAKCSFILISILKQIEKKSISENLNKKLHLKWWNCYYLLLYKSSALFFLIWKGFYKKIGGATVSQNFLQLKMAKFIQYILDYHFILSFSFRHQNWKLILLWLTTGNQNLTYEDNCLIFKEVYKFIRRPQRFLIV
jgi:hypothetical protein